MRKPVEGYEGYYEIDEMGNVYSIERIVTGGRWGRQRVPSRKLKWIPHSSGYLVINLAKNGKIDQRRLHILVAQTFIPNPLNLPEVNHKDLDKYNPRKDNLEWCTPLQNKQHAKLNGAVASGFQNGGSKLIACEIMIAHDLAIRGTMYCDIAGYLKVDRNTIPKAIDRVYGTTWRKYLPNLKARAADARWENAAPLPEAYR